MGGSGLQVSVRSCRRQSPRRRNRCLAPRPGPDPYPAATLLARPDRVVHAGNEPPVQPIVAGAGALFSCRGRIERRWRMLSWSAPSGATKARARSSIGCRIRPTSSCASRAATTPAIRSSSTAQTFKLALLPSGIVRPGKLSVIGNGVVLDPYHLLEEIEELRARASRSRRTISRSPRTSR